MPEHNKTLDPYTGPSDDEALRSAGVDPDEVDRIADAKGVPRDAEEAEEIESD